MARGVMIAAPRSGTGKTTLTLALIAALRRRGRKVRAAKTGPDYIDPAFLAMASGRVCPNLDSWAMPPDLLDAIAAETAETAELVIVESAMGLFDGVDGPRGRTGAPADIAARFKLPVLLAIDVTGHSQSAAAVVRGFASHDPEVRIAGVLVNRYGSPRHIGMVKGAVEALGIPVVGALPRDAGIAVPERHLGLVQAQEHEDINSYLNRLADLAERHLDLDAVLACAAPFAQEAGGTRAALPPPGQRIALARDQAFTFVYGHVLKGWLDAGAKVVPFSPLADEPPPEECDACWLPGGYPELHGERLAAARQFSEGLARFAETRPVHGECGGYMVLGREIEDAEGRRHAMTGLLGHATSFAKRRLHLGYRSARVLTGCSFAARGAVIRGHEFHYASVTDPGSDDRLVDLTDGQGHFMGPAGSRRGNATGTFFHAIAMGRGG